MNRRRFLTGSTGAVLAAPACLAAEPSPTNPPRSTMPIIDVHTHFYDPERPEGIPWPGKSDKALYRRVLPDEFQKLTAPFGVTGTVVVEASPRIADNDWLLKLAADNPFLKGIVGRLFPGSTEEFADPLKRFVRNPLFRGIRLSATELTKGWENRAFRDHLAQLTEHNLTLDINGGTETLTAADRTAAEYPKLRIVVNHLANIRIDGKAPPKDWSEAMAKAAGRPHVWCKISALVEGTRRTDGSAPKEVGYYAPVLDVAWKTFGSDRLLFASNWPVSDRAASYAVLFGIVRDYLKDKPAESVRKVYSGNAVNAYGLTRN